MRGSAVLLRILIYSNGSKSSEEAALRGFELAGHLKADVIVLHTVKSTSEISLREARSALTRLEELGKKMGVKVDGRVREGAAKDLILKASEENLVDLIVLGGRDGALRTRVFESLVESVVRNSRCSVLVVK